jgi:import inner membrane translocase subunit TIM23
MDTNQDAALAAATGMDPFLILLGCTAVFMAAGWLIGPTFGNAAFNLRYRGLKREIESKERQFYERIKKHRVDPTSSSMANPVPDYYGEKIGSVRGYRRWLKDQRAFNLKRGAYHGQK